MRWSHCSLVLSLLFAVLPPSGLIAQTPRPSQANAGPTDSLGDALPPGALARLGTMRLRHGAEITLVGFPAHGKHLLSVGKDGTARLWEIATGRELRRISHPCDAAPPTDPDGVNSVIIPPTINAAVSPDGQTLATRHGSETMR